MLTISFIRHGESTDNLRSVWAGWSDAPLSNHGINQAKACAQYFSDIKLSAIYVSDLKRAKMTAQAIYEAQSHPKPPLHISIDLREQCFGIAEGQPWVLSSDEGLNIEKKVFPVPIGREAKFPEGESLNDLSERTLKAVKELILPWIWDANRADGKSDDHIAVVSHGLCISELIGALVKLDSDGYGQERDYRGLFNTAWSRVTISIKDELEECIALPSAVQKEAPLVVRVTHINQRDHLKDITRQKGGIGSAPCDPNQKDIREFFGGKASNNLQTSKW